MSVTDVPSVVWGGRATCAAGMGAGDGQEADSQPKEETSEAEDDSLCEDAASHDGHQESTAAGALPGRTGMHTQMAHHSWAHAVCSAGDAAGSGDPANGAANVRWGLLDDQQGRCVPRERACVRMWS